MVVSRRSAAPVGHLRGVLSEGKRMTLLAFELRKCSSVDCLSVLGDCPLLFGKTSMCWYIEDIDMVDVSIASRAENVYSGRLAEKQSVTLGFPFGSLLVLNEHHYHPPKAWQDEPSATQQAGNEATWLICCANRWAQIQRTLFKVRIWCSNLTSNLECSCYQKEPGRHRYVYLYLVPQESTSFFGKKYSGIAEVL